MAEPQFQTSTAQTAKKPGLGETMSAFETIRAVGKLLTNHRIGGSFKTSYYFKRVIIFVLVVNLKGIERWKKYWKGS